MPADIDDINGDVVVVQCEDIEEVAGKFIAGKVLPRNMYTLIVGGRTRQKGLLHFRCGIQVSRHPCVGPGQFLVGARRAPARGE